MDLQDGPLDVNLHAIPLTVIRIMPTPIIRRANVRCSLPVVLRAPNIVPIIAHNSPINAIRSINHRMDTPLHERHVFEAEVSVSLTAQLGLR
jgi:hypothetical protein